MGQFSVLGLQLLTVLIDSCELDFKAILFVVQIMYLMEQLRNGGFTSDTLLTGLIQALLTGLDPGSQI